MHICASIQGNADLIISHVIAPGKSWNVDERKGCGDGLKQ